ncbi:hypothetical protein FXO37_03301 [Capsicum annuum]|nr:hypothetical protein FXO37_03301 [Capsicum annuum]
MILLSMVMCSPNRASKNSKMMPRILADSKAGVEATEKGSHNRSWKGKAVVVGSETSGDSMIPKYKFFDFLRFHGHADPSGWLNRCEPFFRWQQTPEGENFGLASFHLEDQRWNFSPQQSARVVKKLTRSEMDERWVKELFQF